MLVEDVHCTCNNYYIYQTFAVKQVFSTMEFLGWYTIGDLPNADDVKFHEQVGVFFHQC